MIVGIVVAVSLLQEVECSRHHRVHQRTPKHHPQVLAFINSGISHKLLSHSTSSINSELYSEKSCSSDLDTAFEWLGNERCRNEPKRHKRLSWLDPSPSASVDNVDGDIMKRMPIYPLGAVHVPHSEQNHTIVSTEPKNVKMAMVRYHSRKVNFLC